MASKAAAAASMCIVALYIAPSICTHTGRIKERVTHTTDGGTRVTSSCVLPQIEKKFLAYVLIFFLQYM